jgi:single-stranded DNA-binding protein
MNSCHFTGYLVDNPNVYKHNGVSVAEFVVVVYNYRKTKSTGEKSRTPAYLNCEAWHTGADILDRYAEKGTKITFMATAKNMSKDDHTVVFRINEFDLCHPEFED